MELFQHPNMPKEILFQGYLMLCIRVILTFKTPNGSKVTMNDDLIHEEQQARKS